MMTSSSLPDDMRHAPVRINYSKARAKYAKGGKVGGLAKAAENVRQAGRMGDDMVVHVNKREFDEMCRRWGKPTVNPDTGMPEFFLGDIFSSIGDLITSGSSYLPVVGESVSEFLKNNPGAAQAIGSGLLGAGAGQLLGGNTKSTLLGGALGALAPSLLGGAGLFGGAGAAASSSSSGPADKGIGDDNGPPGQTYKMGSSGGGGDKSSMRNMLGALILANAIGKGLTGGANKAQKAAEAREAESRAQFNKPLPVSTFNKQYTPFAGDPRRYGYGGQPMGSNWFENNQLPSNSNLPGFADGGSPRRPRSIYEAIDPRFSENTRALVEHQMRAVKRFEEETGKRLPEPDYNLINPFAERNRILRERGYADGGKTGEDEYSFEPVRRGLSPDAFAAMEGLGRPYASGAVSVPMLGGRVSLQGGYLPDKRMPLKALGLTYERRFAKGGSSEPMGGLAMMHVSGRSPNYVRGPGGPREDKIPALLSDSEYVVDAETLALLGDGSSEMGAKKMDALRENVRRHKGRSLVKGKITPNAKKAEAYMRGGAL